MSNRLTAHVVSVFSQLLLFTTYSAFFSPVREALVGPNAPGPVQSTESEKTCTLAVSVLPLQRSEDFSICPPPGIVVNNFLGLEGWPFLRFAHLPQSQSGCSEYPAYLRKNCADNPW